MSHLIDAPPPHSPAWHAWRLLGIGASEVPALMGVDPYRGPWELCQLKRGEVEAFAGNAATRWGNIIEGLALDAYEEIVGEYAGPFKVERGETWGHECWPHLWASLDGRHGHTGVEVKATMRWRDVLPDNVILQVQAQMGLADLQYVDVVRVSPYGEPLIQEVQRDDDVIDKVLDAAEVWYERHVIGDEPVPLDGSRAARDYLDGLRGEATTTASAEQARLAGVLHALRVSAKAIKAQDRQVVNDLKASMAGYGTLEGDDFRITWRARKGITRTDWRAVAQAYRALLVQVAAGGDSEYGLEPTPLDLDALESIHTMVEKPGTQFRPTWTEQEEEDSDDD